MSERGRKLAEFEECTADLRHEFIAPSALLQTRRKISPLMAVGAMELSWYRGQIAAQHECYLWLKENGHAKAAKALLRHLGMSEDGSIGG